MISATRFQQIWSGLNGSARKVYEAVPHEETWTPQQLCTALSRAQAPMTLSIVQGCLDMLRNTGLVKQTKDGFKRVPVRKKQTLADLKDVLPAEPAPVVQPTPEPQKAPMTSVTALKPASKKTVVDILSDLSQQVAATTARHQQEMAALAALIADAAIDVQVELDKNASDLAAWHQIQSLLKGAAA